MEKNDITTKVLIGLVSVMLVAVIVLGYLLYKTSKEKEQIKKKGLQAFLYFI